MAWTPIQRLRLRQTLWLLVYLGLVLTPLVVLILMPTPAKRGLGWDVGIGLGFAGLVMMGMQFLLTARFRLATAPFGLDAIYYLHRYLAYGLLLVLIAHPVILVTVHPRLLYDFNPITAPWAVTAGVASLAVLLVLVVASAFRKQLGLSYELWRYSHWGLALVAVGLALGHMLAIGYYSGPAWTRGLWILIGLSLVAAVVEVRILRPWRLLARPYRVQAVRGEPGEVWTLILEPDGHDGFRYKPGQFAWLVLGHSPFALREHPFSIASTWRPGGRIEFAIKQRGDFTQSLASVQPGQRAYVDGPYGAFTIDHHPHACGYVFVAGGIGLAPMLSMLRALADRGDTRRHVLFLAQGQWDRIPYREEIEQLAETLRLKLVVILEQPPKGWTGETGWIDRGLLDRHLPDERAEYEYFICGPVPMIRTIERSLIDLKIPSSRLHTELFDLV